MTVIEAMEGIKALQRHYGRAWSRADWQGEPFDALLKQPAAAFTYAIGDMRDNTKHLPTPDYVVSRVDYWRQRLGKVTESRTVTGDEGLEVLALMADYTSGTLNRKEYAAGMAALAERHGRMEYQLEAERLGR